METTEDRKPGEERSDNVLDMKLFWCPPGTFLMGSSPTDPDRLEDENQHEVTLSSGFWLGKFPVTQTQWTLLSRNSTMLSWRQNNIGMRCALVSAKVVKKTRAKKANS